MTYQEAKEAFKMFIMIKTSQRPVFADLIEEALDRQIEADVKVFDTHPLPLVICPRCNSTYVTRNQFIMKYCNNCGQALKAEETEGQKEA